MKQSSAMSDERVERVADAIEQAECHGREGPFGGYDYGHNTDFYGPEPEGGRYVVRDFRDRLSDTWGKWVHQTHDRDEHEIMLRKMTREHIARAALEASGLSETERVGSRVVELYKMDRLRVATICDEQLDRSGNLLGYIRSAALPQAPEVSHD